jgi:hypothetical protein
MALKLSAPRPLCSRPATVALTSIELLLCATLLGEHMQERVGGVEQSCGCLAASLRPWYFLPTHSATCGQYAGLFGNVFAMDFLTSGLPTQGHSGVGGWSGVRRLPQLDSRVRIPWVAKPYIPNGYMVAHGRPCLPRSAWAERACLATTLTRRIIAIASAWEQDFMPDAPFVGEINASYIDPEFSEGANQVVFQDIENRVWIGDLDPETGLFKTSTGRDYLLDTNITIIFDCPPQGRKFSTNGPKWTQDEQGYCVVYTKADARRIMQQWLGRIVDGKSVVKQLTRQPVDCYGNMPSRFRDGKPPRVAFTYGWPIWYAKAAWIFLDRPDELHQVPFFDYKRMSMWSAVSSEFMFVYRPPGAAWGQIARVNADSGELQVLTNDPGEKDDPNLFRAPEFGGEICLMASVDNCAIAIYRDLKSPDGFWTRVATLTVPAELPYQFISSPEPIAAGHWAWWDVLFRGARTPK